MGLLDKLWDDHAGGPQPDQGLKKLRQKPAGVPEGLDVNQAAMKPESGLRSVAQGLSIANPMPSAGESSGSPVGSPAAGSPLASSPMASSPMASSLGKEKDNVWRSVFHPGQNKSMKKMGSAKFDNAAPNSPTVYDWLYSSKSKSEYR